VEFDERPLTLIQVIELEYYLSDLLGVKVDLVERDSLKPTIEATSTSKGDPFSQPSQGCLTHARNTQQILEIFATLERPIVDNDAY